MKKYHVATGDGKGYYGVNYETYREATELLKISQRHDPQAHIIEEEYHFTNADRIRAMSDEGIAKLFTKAVSDGCPPQMDWDCKKEEDGWDSCDKCWCKWLKQPAEGEGL